MFCHCLWKPHRLKVKAWDPAGPAGPASQFPALRHASILAERTATWPQDFSLAKCANSRAETMPWECNSVPGKNQACWFRWCGSFGEKASSELRPLCFKYGIHFSGGRRLACHSIDIIWSPNLQAPTPWLQSVKKKTGLPQKLEKLFKKVVTLQNEALYGTQNEAIKHLKMHVKSIKWQVI